MADTDKFIQTLIDIGQQALVEKHSDELIQWMHLAFRYDYGDPDPLVRAFRDAPSIPGPARILLYDILTGNRKFQTRGTSQRKYTAEEAWYAAWMQSSVMEAQRAARAGLQEIARQVGDEPENVKRKISEVHSHAFAMARDSLGVSELTMANIGSDFRKRLKALPKL